MSILDLKRATANATFSALIVLAPGSSLPADATVISSPTRSRAPLGSFDDFVRLPEVVSQPQQRLQAMMQELKNWTGWSDRRLAPALGVSHPTVAALAAGRSTGRPADVARVTETHAVIRQIFLLVGGDSAEISRILMVERAGSPSPIALLAEGRSGAAYLAAIDAVRPRSKGRMLQSKLPSAKPGRSTVSLDEG